MSKQAKQDSQDIGNAIEELNLHYFGFVYVKIHAKMGLLVSPDMVGLDDTKGKKHLFLGVTPVSVLL